MIRTLRFTIVLAMIATGTVGGLTVLRSTHAQNGQHSFAQRPARFTKGSLSHFTFKMIVSAGAKTCLPSATATVSITRGSGNDTLSISIKHMAKSTDFDLMVLQIPNKPFGVAWYQTDISSDANGNGSATVKGIFNEETFALSLGGPANGTNPSQNLNGKATVDTDAQFRSTNMYHLGVWFSRFQDARRAGCPATQTPFSGSQLAGIQVLNTGNFSDTQGPLSAIKS